MGELTYRQALAVGIAQEMRRDPKVVLIGEDVGAAGGVFKLTEGLFDEFGPDRVRDTPISEQAIFGAAMGAAIHHQCVLRARAGAGGRDSGEALLTGLSADCSSAHTRSAAV